MMGGAIFQHWELGDVPFHKLVASTRKLERGQFSKTVRIAVLGDAASQHYCQVLGAILKRRGWWPEIYEAEYDTIQLEVLNPQSGLHAHKPQCVVLFHCVQAALTKFMASARKETFADEYIAELHMLWQKLADMQSTRIIQHMLVAPLDRPLGNQTLAQPDTFLHVVRKINDAIIAAAGKRQLALVDTDYQASYFGKRDWFDERLWCQAKQALSPNFLPHLTQSVADILLAELGDMTKCVIVDLDNTMWGGILGDVGADQIEIGHAEMGLVFRRFQYALLELKRRGMILAICSKNNLENVLSVLDSHPDMVLRRDDFAAIVANYEDKVSNIKEIQKKLNIGFDSMVFLDDSPFERDHVRTALPDVLVPELPEDPADYLTALAKWSLFEGKPVTEEDRNRQAYYRDDEKRAELKTRYGDFSSYLQDLNMQAKVSGIDAFTLPRVLQLVQRSNQFNLTTIRYSEAELEAIGADENCIPLCVQLTDRIGDNGIIAVVILRIAGRDMKIDTWIMSCRVLSRGVEDLTLNLIAEAARKHGCERIVGQYIATSKNAMVKDLYARLGFADAESALGTGHWMLNADKFTPKSNFITISE